MLESSDSENIGIEDTGKNFVENEDEGMDTHVSKQATANAKTML